MAGKNAVPNEQARTEAQTPAPVVRPVEQTTQTHTFTGNGNALNTTEQAQDVTPTVTGDEQGETGKVFTQAQIDSIIAARLAQERSKYADYDDLKARVQAQEDATKTEAERQAERLQSLQASNQKLAEELRTARIATAAAVAGLDTEAAVKLIDQTAIQTDEAGNITNATELVAAVLQKYPGLAKKTTPATSAINPAKGTEVAGRTDADRRAKYFGGGGGSFWNSGGVRWAPVDEQ